MKFENIQVMNFKNALRGMRNPKDSWHLSDSAFGLWSSQQPNISLNLVKEAWLQAKAKKLNLSFLEFKSTSYWEDSEKEFSNMLETNGILQTEEDFYEYAFIGPADMKLAQTLIRGGSEHRKFMRQIFISVDITAPLYWWKEFDTYKVGTTANSTSTMHTITNHPILWDCFEIDDYDKELEIDYLHLDKKNDEAEYKYTTVGEEVFTIMEVLETLRRQHLFYKDIAQDANATEKERKQAEKLSKKYWKELIRWLPESWLQTRTVTMTYENLFSMVNQRKSHKLNEWSGKDDYDLDNFIKFAKSLPYAEYLIFLDK